MLLPSTLSTTIAAAVACCRCCCHCCADAAAAVTAYACPVCTCNCSDLKIPGIYWNNSPTTLLPIIFLSVPPNPRLSRHSPTFFRLQRKKGRDKKLGVWQAARNLRIVVKKTGFTIKLCASATFHRLVLYPQPRTYMRSISGVLYAGSVS